jgi:hypothetical protein
MTAALIGVFGLVVVFLWSGLGKILRPEGTAQALVFFGLTAVPHVALVRLLAALELAVAAGLVVSVAATTATLLLVFLGVAAVLFFIFSFLIGRSLRRGERFSCHCFGAGAEPLSAITLGRAVALLVLALALLSAVAFVMPGASPQQLVTDGVAAIAAIGFIVTMDMGRRLLAYAIVLSHQGVLDDRR